jgi:hypothetical protein
MLKKLLISAAIAGFASSAAMADHLVTVTWTGKVNSGADIFNLFGASGGDMTGADFTSTYVFKFVPADYQLGTVTFSDGTPTYPFFGDLYGAPVSASFTIGANTISVGSNLMSDLYARSDPQQFFPPDDQSHFETDVENEDGDQLMALFQRISKSGETEPWSDLSFADYDGDVSDTQQDGAENFFGMGYFSTLQFEQLGLTNQHLTIVNSEVAGGVPEMASWAMMVSGFGLIGAALRGRRKVAVRFA